MLPETFLDTTGRTVALAHEPVRQGGQAIVYKASLEGRPVAVKVYQRGFARADTERRMLEEILRDDPAAGDWLVTVLASGTVSGRPFIVLPWMDASLTDWIPVRPLPIRIAALVSATEAVARLHRSRQDLTGYRVHRDIKPDNLLVSWEGRWVVRLADLGAAKEGDSLAHTSNTGVLTETFAPPEQALPVEQEPRESWDVHALAVTVFWGLTDRVPIAALEAPGLLNADGRQLVTLARKGIHGALKEEDRERYRALRTRRPEQLLELDTAVGWLPDDTAHLRRALDDAGLPPDVVDRLVDSLATALASALAPDWRHRDNDVRRLLSALRACASALPVDASADAGSPSSRGGGPAPATPPPGAPPMDPVSARRAPWSTSSLPAGPASGTTVGSFLEEEAPRPPAAPRAPGSIRSRALAIVLAAGTAGALLLGAGLVAGLLGWLAWEPATSASQPEQRLAAAPPGAGASVLPPPAPPSELVVKAPAAERVVAAPATPSKTAPVTRTVGSSSAKQAATPTPTVAATVTPTLPPQEEAPAPALTDVEIRVRACPDEGTTVSLDGGPFRAIGAFGSTFTVPTGAHTVTWRAGTATYQARLDLTAAGRKSFCHAFVADVACRACSD